MKEKLINHKNWLVGGAVAIIVAVVVLIFGGADFIRETRENKKAVNTAEYKMAYDAFNNGNFITAGKILAEEMQKYPRANELKLALANVYLEEGSVNGIESEKSMQAQAILREVEVSGYRSAQLYELLGFSYEIVNDFDNALEQYNMALRIDSNSVNAHFQIGHVYWLKGEWALAKEKYEKAESLINKKTPDAIKSKVYVVMGRVYTDSNIEKSEEYLKKALDITVSRPLKAEIYFNLSSIEAEVRGNLEASRQYAIAAIETDITNELGYIAYARATIQTGRQGGTVSSEELRKSMQYLEFALRAAPEMTLVWFWYGQLNEITGYPEEGIKKYNKALELVATDITIGQGGKQRMIGDINFTKAIAYLGMRNEQEAKAAMRQAFTADPVKTMFMINFMKLDKEIVL